MSNLAILGGEQARKDDYPAWPIHDERDIEAVTRVVKSGQWGGFPYPGPETQRFIDDFLAMIGGDYGVLMANGTITLEVACRAADIGWGDEVIVPAYTFQATTAAPMAAGAIPIIVDIDPETYCISPEAIKAAITEKTRAIIPVHVAAQISDMDAIMKIAAEHDLIVIEDCAHVHGSFWNNQGVGTIGHFGSFSMQSFKIMTGGEGGMLVCREQDHAYKAAAIIDCGRPKDPDGQLYTMGANFRTSELHASLLNVAMQRFPAQVKQREAMIDYMDEALSEVSGVMVMPHDPRHTKRSFYQYVFKIDPDSFGSANNQIVSACIAAEGIPTWSGYPPMTEYDLFQPTLSRLAVPSAFPEYFDFDHISLPNTERASYREGVWLDESIFRAGRDGVDDVVNAVKKIQTALSSSDIIVQQVKHAVSKS